MPATETPRARAGRFPALTPDGSAARALPRTGCVLAFDFGGKRIGTAVGDLELRIPHPLCVLPSEPIVERFRAIGELVTEWRPVLLVVGLPRHDDGRHHALAPRCEKFARSLAGRFELTVLLVDEFLSSAAASCVLGEAGVRGAERKAAVDAHAAGEILKTLFTEIDAAA